MGDFAATRARLAARKNSGASIVAGGGGESARDPRSGDPHANQFSSLIGILQLREELRQRQDEGSSGLEMGASASERNGDDPWEAAAESSEPAEGKSAQPLATPPRSARAAGPKEPRRLSRASQLALAPVIERRRRESREHIRRQSLTDPSPTEAAPERPKDDWDHVASVLSTASPLPAAGHATMHPTESPQTGSHPSFPRTPTLSSAGEIVEIFAASVVEQLQRSAIAVALGIVLGDVLQASGFTSRAPPLVLPLPSSPPTPSSLSTSSQPSQLGTPAVVASTATVATAKGHTRTHSRTPSVSPSVSHSRSPSTSASFTAPLPLPPTLATSPSTPAGGDETSAVPINVKHDSNGGGEHDSNGGGDPAALTDHVHNGSPETASPAAQPAGSPEAMSEAAKAALTATGHPRRPTLTFDAPLTFVLPPMYGQFEFRAPGRRLEAVRFAKLITSKEWDMQQVALVILSDFVFLSVPEGSTVFVLLHSPCPRHHAGVAPTPATYGPTVLRLVLNRQSHMLKVSSEKEMSYWTWRLGTCEAPPHDDDGNDADSNAACLDDLEAMTIPAPAPVVD